MRRDRQSEIVTAVIVASALALALAFGIVLTLSGNNTDDATPTASDGEVLVGDNPTEIAQAATTLTVTDEDEDSDESPTPDDTATSTRTPSPTEPTATDTRTPRPTAESPSATRTPRPTRVQATATNTRRPTRTATRTPTATPTDTRTPTNSPSPTDTATDTDTPTRTPSPTDTDTPTNTPTNTPSNTPTRTPTPTRTFTPSDTPTDTPTSTDTFTPLPTLTFTVFPVTLTDTLAPNEVPCEPIAGWVIYIVRFGDTLYDLSVEYGVSMRTLQVANCLTSLELDVGQKLLVPPTRMPCEPIEYWVIYIVRFGDTLYDLSVEYGVSMRTLQVANCLTSLELDAGQELLVPPTGPVSGNPDYVPPEGCDNPFIQITSPVIGEVVNDGYEVVGLADTPDFGFYRLEVKHAEGALTYHTIHESTARVSSERGLGFIRFRDNYVSAPYWLRVSVYNSRASVVGSCAIQVYFDVE